MLEMMMLMMTLFGVLVTAAMRLMLSRLEPWDESRGFKG